MPFDLEAEIARRLRVAPESVGPVLNAVIDRIRQQVSHFGYARVAGLGTFRGHNGHLAFEPEPVLADEVNARFGGLEDVIVAAARSVDDDEHEYPVEESTENDETLYGPSPGDDYERSDAGIEDEDEAEDWEADEVEGADDAVDAHATIKAVYDPSDGPGAEDHPDAFAADAGRIDRSHEEAGADARVDEPADREETIGDPTGERGSEKMDADEPSLELRREDQEADAEGDEPPVEAHEEARPDRIAWEHPERADAEYLEPYAAGEDEEHGNERFAREYEPAEGRTEEAETEAEAEDRPIDFDAPEDAPHDRPVIEWNPAQERSDADLHAEEEAAMAGGAIGGAAAAAGDEEDYIDEDDFDQVGAFDEGRGAGGHAENDASDVTGETAEAFAEEPEQATSTERAPDRVALPHEGAHEPPERQRAAAGGAGGTSIAGRRSVVLISIGIVVLLAAAAVIYLATWSSPVEEAAGPNVAETPTAQDTVAAAESEGSGTAATDTTDLAGAAQPADPSPDSPPAAQTPLDPLRGTEAIDRAAGGYTLIVFSEVSSSSANTVAATYREQGFRTGVLDDQDGGQTRFRVGVGQFSTLDEAVEARDRLAGNGLPDDAWVRRIQ